jgi:hypothetical protein
MSAYRLAIGITLVYVLWMLVPRVRSFAQLVVSTAARSQPETVTVPASVPVPVPVPVRTVNARGTKLSAASLEKALLQTKKFGDAPQFRCKAVGYPWDYACIPMPEQSTTRLQFGVNVDAKRWVEVSAVVPVGAALPAPR